MPLSEAWAPQLFAQADKEQDNKLTSDEFTNLLKQAEVTSDAAQSLFKSFDTSKDGSLSLDELYAGIKSENASGSTLFQKVVSSYTTDQSGQFDQQSLNSFLKNGEALSAEFWSTHK